MNLTAMSADPAERLILIGGLVLAMFVFAAGTAVVMKSIARRSVRRSPDTGHDHPWATDWTQDLHRRSTPAQQAAFVAPDDSPSPAPTPGVPVAGPFFDAPEPTAAPATYPTPHAVPAAAAHASAYPAATPAAGPAPRPRFTAEHLLARQRQQPTPSTAPAGQSPFGPIPDVDAQ